MSRLDVFHSYAKHPWFDKVYRKLSRDEMAIAEAFIVQHDALDKNVFEAKLNRLFIDKTPECKNWKVILELLSCANAAAVRA